MVGGPRDWRLDLLAQRDEVPLRRSEVLFATLLAFLALQFFWWGYLIVPRLSFLHTTSFQDTIVVPGALLLSAILLGLILPTRVLDRTSFGGRIVLSRQDGSVAGLDAACFVLSLGWMVLVLLEYLHYGISTVVLLGHAALTVLFLPTVTKSIPIPGDEELDEEETLPEDHAFPRLRLNIEGDSFEVGIAIPAEVLSRLRELNAAERGSLYQNNLRAVVIGDQPPTDGTGTTELGRLAHQILHVKFLLSTSPLVLANSVLALVQGQIQYGLDSESTAGFEGGPFEEYGRFPLETLHDGVGDCDCTSILAASLLAHVGFPTAVLLVRIREPEGDVWHAAVGVKASSVLSSEPGSQFGLDYLTTSSGERYLYGETAIDEGVRAFGLIPPQWRPPVMEVEEILEVESVV